MKFNPIQSAVFCLPVLLCKPIIAQEKHDQKDDNEIETLVISASPMSRSILESATPVSILSGEELIKTINKLYETGVFWMMSLSWWSLRYLQVVRK